MEPAQEQRWCLQTMKDISRLCTQIPWRNSAKPRRRHPCRIGQLTMQSTWSPATICHMGGLQLSGVELNGVSSWVELSWVERYSRNCVDTDHVLKRPDHAFGFGLKDPMPYGRIDEWLLSYDGRYVTGWIMGLRWGVNGWRTIWRLVNMTFREHTEQQEQSRNAAHTSAIMHWVENTGWGQIYRDQMDCGRKWIATGYGWMTRGGWLEVDDRRWISGDGSRETNDNQCLFRYEATKLQSSAELQTYGVPVAWLHRVRYWALFRDGELCCYMTEFQCRIRSWIRSRVTATMPIPHKLYEINLWWSNDH